MALISKWFKHMCTVPPRVYFVAAVFALSTVYVSQEAGLAFAKSEENFRQPPPMMGEGKFQRPPNDNQEGKFKSPEDNKMRLEGQQNQALQMPEGDDRKNGGENMPAFSDEEFDKRQAQMEAQRADQMKKQFEGKKAE